MATAPLNRLMDVMLARGLSLNSLTLEEAFDLSDRELLRLPRIGRKSVIRLREIQIAEAGMIGETFPCTVHEVDTLRRVCIKCGQSQRDLARRALEVCKPGWWLGANGNRYYAGSGIQQD